MQLNVIYLDAHYAAIDKPAGLLVHRSPLAADARVFALQLLRDQLGQAVYPCHRLDRPTSGVLLFALDPANGSLCRQVRMKNSRGFWHSWDCDPALSAAVSRLQAAAKKDG